MTENPHSHMPIILAMLQQNPTPRDDHLPWNLQRGELAKISPYTTGKLKPSDWTPTNGLPSSWVPWNESWGWTPSNTTPVPSLPSYESAPDTAGDHVEIQNAQQYHEEEDNVDPGSAADAAASGKYFDYVSYIRRINTTDVDSAAVHDQFYTRVPPTDFPQPEPVTGLSRETHDSNEDGSQDLTVQGTEVLPQVSLKPHDVASDTCSVVVREEPSSRKRSASQTASEDDPAAKKYKHAKCIFHPKESAWLILLHEKIKAVAETSQHIKLPGPGPIAHAFNAYFEGRVLKDKSGQDLPPRGARVELSIRNKIMKPNTKIWELRDATRKVVQGKRGDDVYVPEISEEEL